MILPRSTRRVTVLAASLVLTAAGVGLQAEETSPGLDREVVVVGEDSVVLRAPEPAGWASVELPDLDLSLPSTRPDPPLVPPRPPWGGPAPVQVIALMEVPDA